MMVVAFIDEDENIEIP
ncbi:hypothetical protein Gotri_007232 [Gossypium trilobum]|uniref:Uncharacterized protein n=1 Tax=Gossypium trilobum TaxID=34281 RepID=A0A7J9EG40_9ROSI|nr:hypothetical protein [Gossypium trilobum]